MAMDLVKLYLKLMTDWAAAAWLLLVSLGKLLKDRNELCDKINQLQNKVKDSNELGDKVDQLHM